jgi:transcriptional regulator with XRE-family HTH domain
MLQAVALQKDVLTLIRAELGRRSWSALDFARRVGWTQSKMSRAMNAKTSIELDDFEAMLRALGVSRDRLVGAIAAVLTGGEPVDVVPSTGAESASGKDRRDRLIELLLEKLDELERAPKGGRT